MIKGQDALRRFFRASDELKMAERRLVVSWTSIGQLAIASGVSYRKIIQLLRERGAAYQAAIRLLLDTDDSKASFLRATRGILTVISDWQSFDAMERESPRRAEIARRLRQVDNDCLRLMRSLRPLSQYLDDNMHVFSPPRLVGGDPVFRLLVKADIYQIHDLPEFNRSGLYERLVALRAFCRESLNSARDKKNGASSWLGVDTGGGASVFKENYGSAKWQLVYGSAQLYGHYQEGRLTATEGGPFHEFCAAMYELASGRSDPEESAGLKRYIQFAAPRVRMLSVKGRELRQTSHDPSSSRRVRDLEHEIRALRRELARGPKGGRASTSS